MAKSKASKKKVPKKIRQVLIAYIPVLHEGYRTLLTAHKGAEVWIFGPEIDERFEYLKKEIRALDLSLMVKSISSWKLVKKIGILDKKQLLKLQKENIEVVMPDEDVCHELAETYFAGKKVAYDPIFLRWDKHNALKEKPVVPEERISRKEFDKKMLVDLEKEAQKSSDWWRRIGAAIVKDGKVVLAAHNEHVPTPFAPYINGDPRNAFKRGINVEISSAIHAEARLISEAARQGIALEGASMYVTVFPCPPCAKAIAYSGIKTLYCTGGYAVLDGEDILKAKGVKIIFVEPDAVEQKGEWKGYTK